MNNIIVTNFLLTPSKGAQQKEKKNVSDWGYIVKFDTLKLTLCYIIHPGIIRFDLKDVFKYIHVKLSHLLNLGLNLKQLNWTMRKKHINQRKLADRYKCNPG